MLGELLGIENFSLSTAGTGVTMPVEMSSNPNGDSASVMVIGCVSGGINIHWQMVHNDGGDHQTMPDYIISIPQKVGPGKTPFNAKLSSGTGTLEVSYFK